MERINKRNSKFRCLFGGNDEFPSQRFIESSSRAINPTELKPEVEKITSKQSNGNQMKKLLPKGILNGISSKKRSTSILAKLVGRRRDSSEIANRSSDKRGKNKERLVCNGTACEWRGAKETGSDISSEVKDGLKSSSDKRGKNKERLVCNGTACEWRGAKETVADISSDVKDGLKSSSDKRGKNKERLVCNGTACEWRGAKETVSDISSEVKYGFKREKSIELVCNGTACEWRGVNMTISEISSEVEECYKSGHVDYENDENLHVLRSGSVSESEEKRGKNEELVCNETACEWRGAKESVLEISNEVKEEFESGNVDYYGYDESLHLLRSGTVSESEDTRGKNEELVCNETACEWRGAKETVSEIRSEVKESSKISHVDYYGYGESLHVLRSGSVSEPEDKYGKNKELVCNETVCEWKGAKETVPELSNEVIEDFKSVHVDYYGYDERSGSFSESEEITVSSRIIIDHHDRLTNSISHLSQSSLMSEATNILLERCITDINEDEEAISEVEKEAKPKESGKVASLVAVGDVFASPNGLGSLMASSSGSTSIQPSFDDPNHTKDVGHDEDEVDEKMITESSNQCRRKVQKDVFNYQEDLPLKMVRSNKSFQSSLKSAEICFKNEDPAKYQPSASAIDIDAQVYGPESEDLAFASDGIESMNARLQDLKKDLHQLTVESRIISAKLRLMPKVKHFGQLSAYMEHILQTLENHDTDETLHHHVDHILLNCLEYYYEDSALLRFEKDVFYDYVEQMLIRASKSAAVYPWVNPVKRENQLGLLKPDLENQIRNVVYEIEKDYDEDFCEIYYDKDSEWVQPTNDIDSLGMLIAELVLNDLLQEVVDL